LSLFVDTSAFYAAADSGDRVHDRARAALTEDERLLTSDHVLLETWILLDARLGREAARTFWSAIRDGVAEVVAVGAADLERAWQIAGDFPDQAFSLVDMTSFAVMERLGVARVATFDRHFAVHRYGLRRERAFEIVAGA